MVTLTNVGTAYDAIAASKGLGFAFIDFTGVTSLRVRIKVNKVGTGTQSWQVFNETDGTEIGVFNDAGAAGDRTFDQTFAVSLTGVKDVRVRCKSTVGTDDPVYYGASFFAT